MNFLKRYGKMYIRFDDKNQPEYGFEVEENKIKRFIPLSDDESIYSRIILPELIGGG